MSRVSVRMVAMVLTCWRSRLLARREGAGRRYPRRWWTRPRRRLAGKEMAVVAGGCFWGIQAVFQHVKGVHTATSGYAGGKMKNPDYER